MNPLENIWVVPRERLLSNDTPSGFLSLSPEATLQTILGHAFFTPRGPAEEDPSLKQIIPYLLLREKGSTPARWFGYQRLSGSGEKRLHAKVSIGIGGHINDEDTGSGEPEYPFALTFDALGTEGRHSNILSSYTLLRAPLLPALRRELWEEIEIHGPCHARLAGFLNDDTNAVGQVHFGLVFDVEVEQQEVVMKEPESHKALGFLTALELVPYQETMETWSRFALQGMEAMGFSR